jgi:predicted PurR-regulated permease PerM
VVASIIVIVALAAVSEIVLPMTFAAVLAIVFKPLVRILERHKLWPALAAGIVVLGLLGVVTGVIIATVRGVTQQADHGIVGLILAVPVTVIAGNAIARLRSRGILQRAAELARPAVHTCSTDLDAADPLILRGHFGNHPI